MAKSPKHSSKNSPVDAAQAAQPDRSAGSPLPETARAADSVPLPGGPFPVLPMLFGRYQVKKELGRGQMGAVYLARDTELDRPVALKVARVSASGSATLLKRMEVEAKAAAKVDHPLICKVYDAGEIDGIRFIALQYIEGEDLKKLMKRTGRRRDSDEAVRLIQQILRALEAAHEKGIIHRDLKPENVMLNKKNEPVIMDFGLARKTLASSNAGLTQGMIVGTAAYMSPEQATGRAEDIDHRSDLYAVGVMLFEMLTGEWPFTGGAIEVMGKKCVQEPPSPLSLNQHLHPQLAAVCHKMIAKRKDDRYSTCAEVIEELDSIDLKAPADLAIPIETVDPNAVSDASSIQNTVPTTSKLMNAVPKKQRPRQKPSTGLLTLLRNWWNSQPPLRRWTVLGGAGAGLIVLMAIILFPTPYGIVQIEIDDPTLKVQFDGTTITFGNDNRPIRVSPTASHTLKVLHDDVAIESATQEITLKSGEKRIVKVTLLDGSVTIDGTTVATIGVQPIAPKPTPVVAPPVANSKNAGTESNDTRHIWKGQPRYFEKVGSKKWRESNNHDARIAFFYDEIARTKEYVDLLDITRATGVRIRLRDDVVQIIWPGRDKDWRQLQSGRWETNVPPIALIPFDAEVAESHQKAWAAHLGVTVEDTNGIGMKFVLIPPGKFTMGSPWNEKGREDQDKNEDQAEVVLTSPFWMGKTEVTQEQWQTIMGTTPWKTKEFSKDGPNYPATYVSWNDAQEFVKKLSQREGITYRLSTEAEWEWSCRAGTPTPWSFGDNVTDLWKYAWYGGIYGKGNAQYEQYAHEVGQLHANPFGLYDMHGNVWEWCEDVMIDKLPGGTNPKVTNGSEYRVERSGCWSLSAESTRSANRRGRTAGYRYYLNGFRVAR